MLFIFLIPVIGLVAAFLINKIFPHAQFRGYDVLPFFLFAACNLATTHANLPSFLPYGFLFYFILTAIIILAFFIYVNHSLTFCLFFANDASML